MSENRTVHTSLTTLLCAGALAFPAMAQTPPDTFHLDPIVVTATRVPAPRLSVPAAVTVIPGSELRARGIHFVADALRTVPGASVARSGSEGGLTSLFLRGGESDYVQVMLDGVVLNDPGGAFDFGQLTTDNIERIEIVRGPVSVLYGSDAVTGVVNILTRRGTGSPRLSAFAGIGSAPRLNGEAALCPGYPVTPCPSSADLGSYTTRRWDASLSGGRRALSYSIGASGLDGDGAYAFNNDYRNRTVSARVSWTQRDVDLAVSGRITDGRFHFPTNGAGLLADRNQFRDSESSAVGVSGGIRLGDALELRSELSFHEGDYVVDDHPDAADDTLGFFASHSANRIDRSKAGVHLNVHAAPGAVITVGGEVERQRGGSAFSSESQFGPFASSSYNERSNRAAYAQIVAPLSSITITIGGRTEDNDRFGNFTTWRAGANLRITGSTLLRASAGTAFKEPTFFENYAEGFTRGNPQLEPEESSSWEVGLEHALASERIRMGVTWFDQRFRNLIQYSAQPEPESPNYSNIGEASSSGLEVEAQAALPRNVSARASYTFTDTEVLDEGNGEDRLFQQGETLIRRPRHLFDVSAQVPLGDRVVLGGALTHVGERDDLDFTEDFSGARVTMPAYTTVAGFAQLRLIDAVTLHARVDNLLNQEIREIANFPTRGRRLELGVRSAVGF